MMRLLMLVEGQTEDACSWGSTGWPACSTWIAFAHMDHEGGPCDRVELYLEERSLGDVAQLIVRCDNCTSSLPMSRASVLPYKCSGDRPWLDPRRKADRA